MRRAIKNQYLNLQLEELMTIKQSLKRPTLLMHTCCAVCACWPIMYLSEYFDMTLFFNNDNIYPYQEYERRYQELEKFVEKYNKENNRNVKIIQTAFNGEAYHKLLEPLKDEPEKGKRCILCYSLRMDEAYKYASENNYDYFTTVMTISRQKDSNTLNEIGKKLSTKYPNVKYFYSDLKKQAGLEKGNKIANDNNMYRQNYCGCLYSYQDMLIREKKND